MSEHEHQKFVFDILRLNETRFPHLAFIYAIPNGGHRHVAVAGKLKAEGVKRGISDICMPFPNVPMNPESPHYVGAYVEMKDGKNKATKEQQEFLNFVQGQGYAGIVARSCEEALDFIEYYCGIKLRGRK
jgi:hypothetical protein